MDLENFREKDIINTIYYGQAEKIDEILKKADGNIKDNLENVKIERIIEDSNCREQLKEVFDKIEDNYNIKTTEYNKEMYKQGFIDGVNLILNCLKE